jgi:hypothetical protein
MPLVYSFAKPCYPGSTFIFGWLVFGHLETVGLRKQVRVSRLLPQDLGNEEHQPAFLFADLFILAASLAFCRRARLGSSRGCAGCGVLLLSDWSNVRNFGISKLSLSFNPDLHTAKPPPA